MEGHTYHAYNIHLVGIFISTILLGFLAVCATPLPSNESIAIISSATATSPENTTITSPAGISPNQISISFSSAAVSLRLTPNYEEPVFKTATMTATVTTSNPTGYTLYFGDDDGNRVLTHKTNSSFTIASIESAISASETAHDNFPTNTYGYSLNGTNFKPIPEEPVAVKTTGAATTATNGSPTTTITLGVKINSGLPKGTYSNAFIIRAITNYNPDLKTFDSITSMQEMESYICEDLTTPAATINGVINTNVPEKSLIDTRDGSAYTVRKLADGNCWMTEDLKFGADTVSTALTPDTSAVLSNFTLPAAENGTAASSLPWAGTTTHYAKLGNNYYYNWYAATAGSGTSAAISTNATASLCPKGWGLPANDPADSSSASFRGLLSAYNLLNSNVSDQKFIGSGPNLIGILTSAPLSFNLNGFYDWTIGYLRKDGTYPEAHYWTKTASGTANGAFNFQLHNLNGYNFPESSFYNANNTSYNAHTYGFAYPQAVGEKANGYQIRCVIKGT